MRARTDPLPAAAAAAAAPHKTPATFGRRGQPPWGGGGGVGRHVRRDRGLVRGLARQLRYVGRGRC